jgi:hypothetical protein
MERLRLEERAEALRTMLVELLDFDGRHRLILALGGLSVHDAPPGWGALGVAQGPDQRGRTRYRLRPPGPQLREGGAVPAGARPADGHEGGVDGTNVYDLRPR